MDIAIEDRDKNGGEFITAQMLFPDHIPAVAPAPTSQVRSRSRSKKAA